MGVSLEFGVIVNARHWRISRCPFLPQAVAVACLARGLAGCANKEPSLPASQAKHPRVETCCPQCLHESLHLLPSWLQLHFPVRCSAGLADAWPVLLPRRFIGKELLVELKTQLFFQPLHFSTLNQRLCWPEQLLPQFGITAPPSRTTPVIEMATNGEEVVPSKYVTLISADGFEFVVLREATLISPTIKGMLRSPFAESKTGRCEFPEIKYVSIALPRLPHHFHGHDVSHDEISDLPITPDRPCPQDSGLDERDLHLI